MGRIFISKVLKGYIFNERQKSKDYSYKSRSILLPIVEKKSHRRMVFQQDNAVICSCNVAMAWFAAHNVPVMARPPENPNLNQIEILWLEFLLPV